MEKHEFVPTQEQKRILADIRMARDRNLVEAAFQDAWHYRKAYEVERSTVQAAQALIDKLTK